MGDGGREGVYAALPISWRVNVSVFVLSRR